MLDQFCDGANIYEYPEMIAAPKNGNASVAMIDFNKKRNAFIQQPIIPRRESSLPALSVQSLNTPD